ncbi:uncharacterized protein I206_100570 [Kwoniella pini CBS 10737]|uniref:Uncharacterized protein n=1 Tax=Kwoniella pini CBS 10737 TaxID=1296096 RepID=A0A1B9ICW8_9TREE|nr:uncharacterized protein I206_00755 [Kwoniella pini CBS 10737]OCF53452.1 hypothetical protein I206_00755 [Kwoniella pini CBS 10737]
METGTPLSSSSSTASKSSFSSGSISKTTPTSVMKSIIETTASYTQSMTSPIDLKQNSNDNPLDSTSLKSLAKSLPTYLIVGGTIIGILLLITFTNWFIKRRKRRMRFGNDDDNDNDEVEVNNKGWNKISNKRIVNLEKGLNPIKTIDECSSVGISSTEFTPKKEKENIIFQTPIRNQQSSSNLRISTDLNQDTPTTSQTSSPMSSRIGSHENLMKMNEK